ncbi:hypothetical protein ME763_37400 (plasmid) [Streptomyces murinus]|uniref:hypothetical protein n=1 Tax=Streptomyces murinus TaxID=33900 RepID=UPI00118066C3|nr:hypothetical protein [Streptomyces murinus]WDO11210.1 hypothetical protein ME763_37400 [Streptomyces murinus]
MTNKVNKEDVVRRRRILEEVITTEKELSNSHYAFYHAQDPRLRVAQDIYKRVYERFHGTRIPKDFHFLRYPGPGDSNYSEFSNISEFFASDMLQHGIIDDNMGETKAHIISANLALHGGMGHPGEETFRYFLSGKGQTEIPVNAFIKDFLRKFGLPTDGLDEVFPQLNQLNESREGSLFQILIPKRIVDDVAYVAHPHGLPHDDELLLDLHMLGAIKYNTPAGGTVSPGASGTRLSAYEREKMNDEITRNLQTVRDVWSQTLEEPSPIPPSELVPAGEGVSAAAIRAKLPQISERGAARRAALTKKQVQELHSRTMSRFKSGEYSPSRYLEDYVNEPEKLVHEEFTRQKKRIARNPEHFAGQGMRSLRELDRIANRSNFMQARLLVSKNYLLNPESGLIIKRYETISTESESAYEILVDRYVSKLFE